MTLTACVTTDQTPSAEVMARGRTAVDAALASPGSADAVTLFLATGYGDREVLRGAAIEGDQVCGVRIAGTAPTYRSGQGMGIQRSGTSWVDYPPEQQLRLCVAFNRIARAEPGSHSGLSGLRWN